MFWGCFINLWGGGGGGGGWGVRNIWEGKAFLEGLVKLGEIRNVEDLM